MAAYPETHGRCEPEALIFTEGKGKMLVTVKVVQVLN
jgi:hypothetical protein